MQTPRSWVSRIWSLLRWKEGVGKGSMETPKCINQEQTTHIWKEVCTDKNS